MNPWLISFGRCHGRPLRDAERQRMETLLPQVAIADPALLPFANEGELWLEIGFGGGEHLAAQAALYPHIQFIGCEPFMNGVSKLLRQIEEKQLPNIRIWHRDARLLLEALPEARLSRVFLLFPDPWPKARHHKRRIVNTAFLDLLAKKMRPDAELRIATDHVDYSVWIREHCDVHPAFVPLARTEAELRQPPPDWVPTRYQEKAEKEGRMPWFLRYQRRVT